MIKPILSGFVSEIEKLAGIKETLPWAISRGLTGGASTLAIGLTMSKALHNMKHKGKDHKEKGTVDKLKNLLPVAATGAATGLVKGMAEKGIESALKKALKV